MVNLSDGLTFEKIARVVEENEKVELGLETAERISRSFNYLGAFAEKKVIYGINTGFGPMAQYRVDDIHLRELQYNIIRSH